MKVEVESQFNIGDKVDLVKNNGSSNHGKVIKVEWVTEPYRLFKYLVEFSDESRVWLNEGVLRVHYSHAESLKDLIADMDEK